VHGLWALSRHVRRDAALRQLVAGEPSDAVLARVERDPAFASFRSELRRYLEAWGFRCSQELMLTLPSLEEAPAPVIDLLRAYAQLDGDSPVDALRAQAAMREAETARVLRAVRERRTIGGVPGAAYARLVRLVLAWTHASIRFRERARLKQALLYTRCRRVALAAGERLVAAGLLASRDDVFWLTIEELDELLAGGAMLPHHARELVALRARAHAETSAAAPPDRFTLGEGEYLPLRPGAGTAGGAGDPSDDASLVGTGACGGRVTARATVLQDVTEAGRLARGDVLVTRQTDPGWGPVFFLIGGLVIERGGMLSHGAIIAREFGIPCVVAVRDATRRVPEGRTVTVDGDRGTVHVLD